MEMILMTVNNQSVNNRQYNNRHGECPENSASSNLVIITVHIDNYGKANWKKVKQRQIKAQTETQPRHARQQSS